MAKKREHQFVHATSNMSLFGVLTTVSIFCHPNQIVSFNKVLIRSEHKKIVAFEICFTHTAVGSAGP